MPFLLFWSFLLFFVYETYFLYHHTRNAMHMRCIYKDIVIVGVLQCLFPFARHQIVCNITPHICIYYTVLFILVSGSGAPKNMYLCKYHRHRIKYHHLHLPRDRFDMAYRWWWRKRPQKKKKEKTRARDINYYTPRMHSSICFTD